MFYPQPQLLANAAIGGFSRRAIDLGRNFGS
jgi:hypothetical protein